MMRGAKGFTLVDLMIGVVLMGLVLMALMAVSGSLYQSFQADARSNNIKGGTLMSIDQLSRDIRGATYISSPTSPCPGGNCSPPTDQYADVLLGCTNWDSNIVAGGGPIDPTLSVKAFEYYVDGNGQLWYVFASNPPFPGVCPPGGAPPDGATPLVLNGPAPIMLATQVSHDSSCDTCAPGYFHRPAQFANLVELHYQVGLGTAAVVVDTWLTTAKSINSPTP